MEKQDKFNNSNSDIENTHNIHDDHELENSQKKVFPKKIKLEITTAFESAITALALLAGFSTAGLLFHFNERNMIINPYTLTAIAVTIMLIILRLNIDEYYVLDSDKQAIMLRKKMFSNETYAVFAPFNTIEATVGNGRYNNGGKNSPGYWQYRAEIILNTGKVVPVDDWNKEDLVAANSKAKSLAELANAKFIQGKRKVNAKPILENGKYTFLVKEKPPFSIKINGFAAFLIVTAIVGGLAFYIVNYL